MSELFKYLQFHQHSGRLGVLFPSLEKPKCAFSDICPGPKALWRNWSKLNYASHDLSHINRLFQSAIFPFEEIKSQIRALGPEP